MYYFPYTNIHELNLDWLLRQMVELKKQTADFININSIKYADPLQWNITTQYEANTVVINPEDSTAYLSVRAVPAGVNITNTEYWTPIGNFAELYSDIKASISAVDAGSGTTTPAALAVNELIWWNNVLYRAIAPLPAGTALIVGTNIEEITISDILYNYNSIIEDLGLLVREETQALNDKIDNEIERSAEEDTRLDGEIRELRADAMTWRKQYLDSATSSYIDTVNGNDETAELYDPEKPFKTLEAAWEAAGLVSNDFRFYFVTRGDYFLPARVISGAVIHFNALVDGVYIYTKNDYGNLFLYDAHINLRCENTNGRIRLIARDTEDPSIPAQIEAEGSTVWVNRGDFYCSRLYMIQGSASLTNCTVDGRIESWFADIRSYNLRVNNTENQPAIYMMCGTLRVENQPLIFGANSNATSQPAILLNTCMMRVGNNITQEDTSGSYGRILRANSSVVYCSDAYWTRLTNQAPNESLLDDNALRLRGASTPSVYPPI